jgi:hypothetical protein
MGLAEEGIKRTGKLDPGPFSLRAGQAPLVEPIAK